MSHKRPARGQSRFQKLTKSFGVVGGSYVWIFLAACVVTVGPTLIAARVASTEDLSENAILSHVPDGTLAVLGRVRRPHGMPPWMFNSAIRACQKAGISPVGRFMQSIGTYSASAGFHLKDGVAHEDGVAYDYTCAIDLRSKDLSPKQTQAFLNALTDANFDPFWRNKGKFLHNQHIHANFTGYPCKPQLEAQDKDWENGRNGLVGHARETNFIPTKAQIARNKAMRLKYVTGHKPKKMGFDFPGAGISGAPQPFGMDGGGVE